VTQDTIKQWSLLTAFFHFLLNQFHFSRGSHSWVSSSGLFLSVSKDVFLHAHMCTHIHECTYTHIPAHKMFFEFWFVWSLVIKWFFLLCYKYLILHTSMVVCHGDTPTFLQLILLCFFFVCFLFCFWGLNSGPYTC
jgi:hypothetical protein